MLKEPQKIPSTCPAPDDARSPDSTDYRTVADFTFDWELWIGSGGETRYVSPSCERVSGYAADEVRDDPGFFPRIIHPDDYPGWHELMLVSRKQDVPSLDFRIIRRDGGLTWVAQETTRVLGPDDGFQGWRLSLRDVTDRVAAQQALKEAGERLEERVRERTAELDRANRELRLEMRRRARARRELEKSRERYRNLAAYQQERIEEERKRIAREVHDELGQNLTALNLGLFSLEGLCAGTDGAPDRLAGLRDLVRRTMTTVQRIARELRPAILDELGLCEALSWGARNFESGSGIRVEVEVGPGLDDVDPEISVALYRVFQEALTNAARHSGASVVRVRLYRSGRRLRLEIRDDGRGLPPEALDSPDSLGLIGMQERVRNVGGRLSIGTENGGGAVLRASLPVGPAGLAGRRSSREEGV